MSVSANTAVFPKSLCGFHRSCQNRREAWFSENETNFRPGQIFATLPVCVSFLRCVANGRRYGKCGIKLLLNCLPAQMYIKISNVSTNTHTRICYSVCCNAALSLMSEFNSNLSLKKNSKRTRVFASWCLFQETTLSFPNASADFFQVVMDAEKFGFQ